MPRFADIPMPAGVRALPSTHSGMPVPWTTRYHDADNKEQTELVHINRERTLWCNCQLGDGLPKLGKPCPHRQRQGMLHRRCVVCGRKISDRVVPVFLGIATGHMEGRPSLHSVEPPAHADCAAYSALACPRLVGGDDVHVALTKRYEVWKEIKIVGSSRKDIKPLGAPPNPTGAVDLYCAIINPAHATVMPLTQWMATTAPKPYRALVLNGSCPA